MASFYDKKLVALEQERREIQAELNRNVQSFRAEYQRKELRREYDLSDPSALRSEPPARVGDDDARIGASSLQRFDGEDLAAGERRRTQLAQQHHWCEKQAAEKKAAQLAAKAADLAHAETVAAQEEYMNKAAAHHKAARAAFERSVAEENARLAQLKAQRDAEARAIDAELASTEAKKVEADPMINEDPAAAASAVAPGARVRVDHWKGMNYLQVRSINETVAAQRAELEQRRAREAAEEAATANASERVRRALEQRAEQVEAFKREQRMAVLAAQNTQRAEKVERDATARSVLGVNTVEPEYFAQFGTSWR